MNRDLPAKEKETKRGKRKLLLTIWNESVIDKDIKENFERSDPQRATINLKAVLIHEIGEPIGME